MNIDIADVLERAADDIATNGLAKNTLLNEAGQCCAIGAIGRALNLEIEPMEGFLDDDAYTSEEIEAVAETLVEKALISAPRWSWTSQPPAPPRSYWDMVVSWNNARVRTADEVVEAMRRAAKDLRNEATP